MDVGRIFLDRLDSVNFNSLNVDKKKDANSGVQKNHVNRIPDENEIPDIVDRMNKTAGEHNERISFSYHEKTRTVIMKVIDSKTNEIVREIPQKNLLKVLENLQEYMGMFVDESR